MNDSGPDASACPRLEDIAVLLDRRLADPERALLLDHLADCELCYTVFASASQSLAGSVRASEQPRRRRLPWLVAGLAIAVVVLALGIFIQRRARAVLEAQAAPSAPTLATALSGSLGARGLDLAHEATLAKTRHAGAVELHLALALIEGRRSAAAGLAATLAERAAANGAGGESRRVFERLAEELSAERPSTLNLPETLVASTFGVGKTQVARCAEASRIAWRAGSTDWFASRLGYACRRVLLRVAEPAIATGIERHWPETGDADADLMGFLTQAVRDPAL